MYLMNVITAARRGVGGEARGGCPVPDDDARHEGHGAGRQPRRDRLRQLHHRRQLRGPNLWGELFHFNFCWIATCLDVPPCP